MSSDGGKGVLIDGRIQFGEWMGGLQRRRRLQERTPRVDNRSRACQCEDNQRSAPNPRTSRTHYFDKQGFILSLVT